ncbi:MAG: hypothetical protein M0Z82_08880 [Actinomycetota bacterium]|nr:hypothetical protein [Actinomycetota bacterium]
MTPRSTYAAPPPSDGPGDAALQRQQAEFEQFVGFAQAMGVKGLRVAGTRIVDTGESRSVEVLFGHDGFVGELFGYRCMAPGDDPHERVWLAEELATGALHRLMRDGRVDRDADGVVWLRLRGSVLVSALPG